MHFQICHVMAAMITLAGLLCSNTASVQEKPPGMVTGITSALHGDGDLPALWRSVDAVVYLRIQEAVRTRTRILNGRGSLWTEYRALVHEAFRRHRGQPDTSVELWQAAANRILPDAPSKSGPEYIAFLKWDDTAELFESVIMVPVIDGGVQSSRIRGLESGMKLEAFLRLLRAMME